MFVSAFIKRDNRIRVYTYCKLCRGRAAKAYREANPEKCRIYRAKYYREHKSEFREYKRRQRKEIADGVRVGTA
jgi:hypothetical protein